jgi:oligoendopeptidase F
MILKDKSVDDELYGRDEPVVDSLYENNISKEDLLAMVNEVVDTYIPISQRFYKLQAKMMKKDQITYADRCFNPVEVASSKITWKECVEQVLEAYGEFSMDFLSIAASIINCNIIDAVPRKGKTSGAYCIRGQVPYILMNFTGSQDDVRTFAHELGHGVHHVLAAKVGTLNDSTPTALAEVASEFAENMIFRQQILKATSNKEKLSLLIGRVQDMINSIHRQIAFYKFEERTHKERKKGELSTERLNQIWREENYRCLGFDIGKDAECMWMGISHIFGLPYYVYSYAFAGLVVNNLIKVYEQWEENGEFQMQEDFDDLYIDMLSNTGVEDFKSLLEPFGIDADAPDFWAKGLSLISDYIDEIEKLAKLEGLI